MSVGTFSGQQFIEFEASVDPSTMWDFEVMRNGHIGCMQCDGRPMWCSHIGRLVAENADAGQMWALLSDMQACEFEIPIFPTSNMWAHVVVSDPTKFGAYRLYYYPPEDALTMADQGQFMGFLHPSEGRNIARSMILDWFMGWANEDDLQCRSSGHKFRQQMGWEAAMKSADKTKFLWSVWTTKSCIACQLGGDDWSDLIPENPETRRF